MESKRCCPFILIFKKRWLSKQQAQEVTRRRPVAVEKYIFIEMKAPNKIIVVTHRGSPETLYGDQQICVTRTINPWILLPQTGIFYRLYLPPGCTICRCA